MLYHDPIGPGSTVGTDFSFRTYFLDALVSNEPLFLERHVSPATDQSVATAVMPGRTSDGQLPGLVATNIHLERLSATLAAIASRQQSDEDLQLATVDSKG